MARSDSDIRQVLSLVPRHRHREIGHRPDDRGRVGVAALLVRLSFPLDRNRLTSLVASPARWRLAPSDTGLRIRAGQGQSVTVDPGLSPKVPPVTLFHGTADTALPATPKQGLPRQTPHHARPSATVSATLAVGQCRAAPVGLRLDARAMAVARQAVFRARNGVWRAVAGPARFLFRDTA